MSKEVFDPKIDVTKFVQFLPDEAGSHRLH